MEHLIIYKIKNVFFACDMNNKDLTSYESDELESLAISLGSQIESPDYRFLDGCNGGIDLFPASLSKAERKKFAHQYKQCREDAIKHPKKIDHRMKKAVRQYQAFTVGFNQILPCFAQQPESGIYLKIKQSPIQRGIQHYYHKPQPGLITIEDSEAPNIMNFAAFNQESLGSHQQLIAAIIKSQKKFYIYDDHKRRIYAVHFESIKQYNNFLEQYGLAYFKVSGAAVAS